MAPRHYSTRVPGTLPVSYTYDSLGRVETVSQGSTMSYDLAGPTFSFTFAYPDI
ncbi:MAG: hypothetical protein HY791_32970 [Deltaproteobacteria bacterium]|nr:hypothetical protein [Deltaproteobacteria bacterium]